MRNFIFLDTVFHGILIGLLSVCTGCAMQAGQTGVPPFCIALEQEIHNGVLAESRLIMVPAPGEYRMEDWEIRRVSVTLPASPGVDGRQQALRAAWENLLLQQGTRRIAGHNQMVQQHLQTRSTLRYEGLVQEPMRIVSFLRGEEELMLTLEVYFAPMAFPDHWERLRKQRYRKENLKEILSVFH